MIDDLKKKFPQGIIETSLNFGTDVCVVERSAILDVLKYLKTHATTPFSMLLDICGVDYLGRNPRFEVVYHLYSFVTKKRIRLKVKLSESDIKIPSAMPVYEIADWFEREAFDMYGIIFEGHPNLKRLLTWTAFEGHPQRKDYPINKRQAIPTLDDIV